MFSNPFSFLSLNSSTKCGVVFCEMGNPSPNGIRPAGVSLREPSRHLERKPCTQPLGEKTLARTRPPEISVRKALVERGEEPWPGTRPDPSRQPGAVAVHLGDPRGFGEEASSVDGVDDLGNRETGRQGRQGRRGSSVGQMAERAKVAPEETHEGMA
jgi:hypothetical protein